MPYTRAMDAARVLLDRELVLSAIVHDVRGPLTALLGWAELADDPMIGETVGRVAGLVDELVQTGPAHTATFEGRAVRVRAPIDILRIAIDELPHRSMEVREQGGEVIVEIHGIPAAEGEGGWSLAQVRRWLAEPGPGLAGARLRIAARMCGALGLSVVLAPGEAESVVTVRIARG